MNLAQQDLFSVTQDQHGRVFEAPTRLRGDTSPRQVGDVCAGRHQGNPQSRAAFKNHRGGFAKRRAEIYDLICTYPRDVGVTCKELANRLGVGMNTISGRFSELSKITMQIVQVHDASGRPVRRDGCAAYKKAS